MRKLLIGAIAAGLSAGPALAASDVVTLTGGFGLSSLSANELVYSGGSKLSQLIWQSDLVPTASVSVDVPLAEGWSLRLSGEGGFGGEGTMTDYDWIAPYATGTGLNDWSDRSISPDTRLDHYVAVKARLGRTVYRSGAMTAGLHGALGYTDTQWSAYGGTYIYSTGGYRNDVGTIPGGGAAVTYRQQLPTALAGVDMHVTSGRLRLSGSADAGVSFLARSNDDHWLRNLNFAGYFDPAPVVAVSARADFAFSPSAGAFVSVDGQKLFEMSGYVVQTDTNTHVSGTTAPGTAGADFASIAVRGGVSGSF